MAKRKASSPMEMFNGDDDWHSDTDRKTDFAATPKRSSLESSGFNVTPSLLSFERPAPSSVSSLNNSQEKLAMQMAQLNEEFITSLAVTLKQNPTALLVPMVESYILHVHEILVPHLPKHLSMLDDDKSLVSVARFLDKFGTEMAKVCSEKVLKKAVTNTSPTVSSHIVPIKLGGSGFTFSIPKVVQPKFEHAAPISVAPMMKFPLLGGISATPVATPMTMSNRMDEEDDEKSDEPPKNEFKPVKEEDSVYDVRCKVYGKIAGAYKDKGLGQLYVKKLSNGKYQVVVRADNTLGTIILNILLQKGIPLSRKGKDVITCDPTGDDGKPMTILIRVKNEDSATKLLEKLQDFLSQSS